MDEQDMRNMILSELIDKMHSRMADKMFPDAAPESKEEPVAAPVEHMDAVVEVPADSDTDLSDSDIDDILKSC